MPETTSLLLPAWDAPLLWLSAAALLAFGVFGLRTMARRSVSLRALSATAAGTDARQRFDADIAGRIADLERFGLAELRAGRLALTPRGLRALAWMRALRLLTGARP